MTDLLMGILTIIFALTAAVSDIKTRRIPNKLILCMLAAWLMLFTYSYAVNSKTAITELIDSVLGLFIGGSIFLSVYLLSRKGLGGGDVKFMSVAGLYLGPDGTIPAILFGTVLAALTGLILILAKKITRKEKLPLAPFLLAGITITVVASWVG